MREPGLAERYARALFGAAVARGAEDRVGGDVAALQALEERGVALRLFLEAPNVRDDAKHRAIDAALGKRAQALTVRFLHLLVAKRRTGLLREAIAAYAQILRQHQGRVRARVLTASPLADDLRESLRVALERRTGKQVEIHAVVDPAVVGGVSVQWGDQILDDTVRTRLKQLRERMLEVEV